jgi:hypothetical protein
VPIPYCTEKACPALAHALPLFPGHFLDLATWRLMGRELRFLHRYGVPRGLWESPEVRRRVGRGIVPVGVN